MAVAMEEGMQAEEKEKGKQAEVTMEVAWEEVVREAAVLGPDREVGRAVAEVAEGETVEEMVVEGMTEA